MDLPGIRKSSISNLRLVCLINQSQFIYHMEKSRAFRRPSGWLLYWLVIRWYRYHRADPQLYDPITIGLLDSEWLSGKGLIHYNQTYKKLIINQPVRLLIIGNISQTWKLVDSWTVPILKKTVFILTLWDFRWSLVQNSHKCKSSLGIEITWHYSMERWWSRWCLYWNFFIIFKMKMQNSESILKNSWTSKNMIRDSKMKNNAKGERLCLKTVAGYVYRML